MEFDHFIKAETEKRRGQLRELALFDANMWFGKGVEFPYAPEIGPANLEEIYAQYGITGGLVSDWKGLTLSAQEGNETLIETEDCLPENTWTVWTGLPLLPKEQGPLPGSGKPNGKLRGIRIFPKSHRYECTSWVLGDLCTWCVEFKVPLFIWHVEADWRGLFEIAWEFKKLTLVVETQWQKILYHNRSLYSLMHYCPNVWIEISNFTGPDFLHHAVNSFGADRFIYGSFLPMNDPFVPIGMLGDADIEVEEKKQIAGKTLHRLIGEVKR